ncbi:MAG: aldose 1-epimerase family protein [Aureliella sp.]
MQVPLPQPIQSDTAPSLTNACEKATTVASAGGDFCVCRYHLNGGASEGVELIVVDSGQVRAAICPTRGMSLWKANIDAVPCGWDSPVVGPVHPSHIPILDEGGLGWLEGFDELLVRCGLRSFGAPDFNGDGKMLYPLHGRIGNLPARDVKIDVDAEHSLLTVSGQVLETRFLQYNLELRASYTFPFGQPVIEVNDTVTNRSSQPAGIQMLYHVNFGAPLLGKGAKFHTGSDRVVARNERAAIDIDTWDTYREPTPGYEEQVYFYGSRADEEGWASNVLTSPDAKTAVAVRHKADTLPYLTQWKNTVAEEDGYVTGLEPGTGFPNPRSFEEAGGRVISLGGGESIDFQLAIEAMTDSARIRTVTDALASQRGDIEQQKFDANWCTPR